MFYLFETSFTQKRKTVRDLGLNNNIFLPLMKFQLCFTWTAKSEHCKEQEQKAIFSLPKCIEDFMADILHIPKNFNVPNSCFTLY